LIFFDNGAVVIPPSYVELGKPFLSSKLMDDILYKRERILAWYCPLVKLSIVLYWS
jgi:hypothetical protein